jgi:16S rRNA (adenine1518-N6/adenine1519-N6)-dimethyltransferase
MDLIQFIKDAKIVPDKAKDQNFLIDTTILDKEAEILDCQENDVVLEIGAGFGSLTVRLAQKCRVLAVEIDPKLCEFLRRIKNTVAMNNDIIKILAEARRDKREGAFSKVAGNIPYNKSQEILLELLKHPWSLAVLCVQKEFAEKLQDRKEKLYYLLQDCCSVEIKIQVPAEKFYPKAVDSSIILIRQKKKMDEDYWIFLQKLFKAKNKNISNVFPDAPLKFRQKKAVQLSEKDVKMLFKGVKNAKT